MPTLRVYKHEGQGHFIGSCIIVIATNRAYARDKIREILIQNGLPKEELDITVMAVGHGEVLHVADGDY